MDPLIHLTIALSFAALFAASAVHQLLEWDDWPGIVRNYRLVPDWLAGVVAVAIPCGEAFCAAALLWPPARTAGAVVAAALLLLFAAALGINIARGRTRIDCGCFALPLRRAISPWMVVRNGVLAILVLSLLAPATPRTLSPFEIVASVGFVATLAFLYPVLDLLFGQWAASPSATVAGSARPARTG